MFAFFLMISSRLLTAYLVECTLPAVGELSSLLALKILKVH